MSSLDPTSMFMITIMLIFLLGVAVGTPAAMVGITGGILFTPALILIFGVSPVSAVGTGLAGMLGSSLSSSVSYIAQKRVDYKMAIAYDLLDIPGAILGVVILWVLSTYFHNFILGMIGQIIFLMAFLLLTKNIVEKKEEIPDFSGPRKSHLTRGNMPFILGSSFLSGVVSGMAGLGGGVVDTTTMILMGMPPHFAGPTSEFVMDFANITALVSHGLLGNIIIPYAIPLFIGACIGGVIGSFLSRKTKPFFLIIIIVTFAWIAAFNMMRFLFFSELLIISLIFTLIILLVASFFIYTRIKKWKEGDLNWKRETIPIFLIIGGFVVISATNMIYNGLFHPTTLSLDVTILIIIEFIVIILAIAVIMSFLIYANTGSRKKQDVKQVLSELAPDKTS